MTLFEVRYNGDMGNSGACGIYSSYDLANSKIPYFVEKFNEDGDYSYLYSDDEFSVHAWVVDEDSGEVCVG